MISLLRRGVNTDAGQAESRLDSQLTRLGYLLNTWGVCWLSMPRTMIVGVRTCQMSTWAYWMSRQSIRTLFAQAKFLRRHSNNIGDSMLSGSPAPSSPTVILRFRPPPRSPHKMEHIYIIEQLCIYHTYITVYTHAFVCTLCAFQLLALSSGSAKKFQAVSSLCNVLVDFPWSSSPYSHGSGSGHAPPSLQSLKRGVLLMIELGTEGDFINAMVTTNTQAWSTGLGWSS